MRIDIAENEDEKTKVNFTRLDEDQVEIRHVGGLYADAEDAYDSPLATPGDLLKSPGDMAAAASAEAELASAEAHL